MSNKNLIARRALLKSGSLALFASALGPIPLFMREAVAAPRKKVLVTIFQRFGMDGLLAVTPYADQHLAKLRPNLMLSHPGSGKPDARLELGDGFGLHPAFSALMPFYQEGRLAIVHGVGQPDPTRSHTTAQKWWETGVPGQPLEREGWLNRALVSARMESALLPAVSLTPEKPRIFYGAQPVTATADLQALMLHNHSPEEIAQLTQLYQNYGHTELSDAVSNSLMVAKILSEQQARRAAASTVAYPENSKLADSLRDIASLIKADVGLQLAFAESRKSPNGKGTWDTHSNAATVASDGPFPQMANDLSQSLSAFMADLGPYQDDVIVTTLTDFGRNVVENKRMGTDHGRATAMFVLGGGVKGGQVYGELPERFDRDALEDGMDLPVTTDFREVLSSLLHKQLGIADAGAVFPGWKGAGLPLV